MERDEVSRIAPRARHRRGRAAALALAVLAAVALAGPATAAAPDGPGPADRIRSALPAGPLKRLVGGVLESNPDLASLEAAEQAAWQRPAQAGALPDPMLGVTGFPEPPQTRVGPQELGLSLSQKFPWFGTLGLRSRAAEAAATGESAGLEAARLRLVTRARRLYWELAFIESAVRIVREDRQTLAHYEELARSRYEAGVGLQQGVIKIQAEITKADARLLDLQTRRAGLLARINALRDGPEGSPVEVDSLTTPPEVRPDLARWRERAAAARPEVAAADARIDMSRSAAGLARKRYLPDLTVGLSYTFVGRRSDAAGLAMPPEDDGSDILGVSLGLSLPLWRGSLAAGVREAELDRVRAQEGRRSVLAGIEADLADLARSLPLTWDRLRLYEDVLGVQAEQSLQSAEAAYRATTIGALDLLDAERVLLEVRIGTARARADYAIALARLEEAVGGPVAPAGAEGEQK